MKKNVLSSCFIFCFIVKGQIHSMCTFGGNKQFSETIPERVVIILME